MRMFDSLIFNVDRRPENWRFDKSSAKLYLIDHSRAFRERRDLPESFGKSLVRMNRSLYDNLSGLDEETMQRVSEWLITGAQIEALLARRDLILQKIDQDREERADCGGACEEHGAVGATRTLRVSSD